MQPNFKNIPIIGAGLSGLITATQFPNSPIIEAMAAPTEVHKSVLRFRTPNVGVLTGIPFRKVKVYKEVFDGDKISSTPTIKDMNNYSHKVAGKIISRSIGDTTTVERYVAPHNFYGQLESQLHNRISYGQKFDFNELCISTVPMNIVARHFNIDVDFSYMRNHVLRFRIDGADVFQTIYVTDMDNPIYRASITGDILMIESTAELSILDDDDSLHIDAVMSLFGLNDADVEYLEKAEQRYGKINPIGERTRKQIIVTLTNEHNIYSIGRFATWRNILLDALPDDIIMVKKLISQDLYDVRKLLP